MKLIFAGTAEFAAVGAELMVVAAFGLILPQAVLDPPRHGCINIHGSLLPRWRGAAPIQRALLAGDAETGVCIMQMEAGLDTGPVLLRGALPIAATDTTASLHDRLAELGKPPSRASNSTSICPRRPRTIPRLAPASPCRNGITARP